MIICGECNKSFDEKRIVGICPYCGNESNLKKVTEQNPNAKIIHETNKTINQAGNENEYNMENVITGNYDLNLVVETDSSNMNLKDNIKQHLSDAFSVYFDKFKYTSYHDGFMSFDCQVKTTILSPCITLKGFAQTKIKEDKMKIIVNIKTEPNGWFWFNIIVSVVIILFYPLLFVFCFAIDFILYYTQKNKSIENARKAFEQFRFIS